MEKSRIFDGAGPEESGRGQREILDFFVCLVLVDSGRKSEGDTCGSFGEMHLVVRILGHLF